MSSAVMRPPSIPRRNLSYTFVEEDGFVEHVLKHCGGHCRVVRVDALDSKRSKLVIRLLMTARADEHLLTYTKEICKVSLANYKEAGVASKLSETYEALQGLGLKVSTGVWTYS